MEKVRIETQDGQTYDVDMEYDAAKLDELLNDDSRISVLLGNSNQARVNVKSVVPVALLDAGTTTTT